MEDLGYNLFNSNAQKFIYYSMALDKSTDVVDTAQYVFIQGIDESFTIAEELSTSQFEEHWNWKKNCFQVLAKHLNKLIWNEKNRKWC